MPALRLLLLVATLFLVVFSKKDANKESFEFKSDVSKMLDIIIHSLYTNRDIYLREIISNASDAIDKIRFLYLTDPKDPKNKHDESPTMDIRIKFDKEKRTITIQDGGIGMTKDDLINHLGSLGASGTKRFLEQMNPESGQNALNMIGQFGVGFYSVFLVADSVKVASKSDADETQWVWESTADGNFFISPDSRGNTLGRGTEIVLNMKKDAEEYLDQEKLETIVKQYSEFIHFPIFIQTEKKEKVPVEPEKKEEADEGKEKSDDEVETKDEEEKKEPEMKEVTTYDWKLINENKPIWTRKPTDITKDEYNNFYKAITKETEDPMYFTHFNAEGEVEFKSILYIPNKAPANLFDHTNTAMTNIRLYVRRVFITDEFKDLLPRYLNFIKGVVDSDDLPLNVSRELLQENRILKIIKKKLIRKALSMLKDIADEDERHEEEAEEKKKAKEKPEEEPPKEGEEKEKEEKEEKEEEEYTPRYPKLWEEFGKNLRLGLIEDSTNRARLTKLLRYKSSKSEDDYISLEDYVDRMPDEQKSIFYIIGESYDKIKKSPLLEKAKQAGVEVLYMIDAIDEYVVGHITEFSGKKLVSLAKEGVKLKEESEIDKKIEKKRNEAWEPFTKWLKKVLGDKIEKATISPRVAETPCVIVSPQYGVTANMERIMKGQALSDNKNQQSAKRIMEINPRHPIIDELRRRAKENEEDEGAKEAADVLFHVCALQSGFALEDVTEFAEKMQRTLKQGLNIDVNAGLVEEEEYEIDEEEDTKGSEGGDDEDMGDDDDEGEEGEKKEGEAAEKEDAKDDDRDEL